MSDVGKKNYTYRTNYKSSKTEEKKLTTNAMINPMLKLTNTCKRILRMYSTKDSFLLMDLIPTNLCSN